MENKNWWCVHFLVKMAEVHVLSEVYAKQLLPNTVVLLIEAFFGIIGNSIVLLMYTRYVQGKTGTRYFIRILALVDLLGCLSNATQLYMDDTMNYVYPSVVLCKTLSFFRIMTGGFSANTILVIALQRYLLICRPLGTQMSRKHCRISIIAMLLLSVGCAAPVLKLGGIQNTIIRKDSGNVTLNISVAECHITNGDNEPSVMVPYYGVLLLLSLINIIFTSVLYIPVAKTIYKRFSPSTRNRTFDTFYKRKNNSSEDTNVEKLTMKEIPHQDVKVTSIEPAAAVNNDGNREQKARQNISAMFLVIIIVYVVSYLASLVTNIHLSVTNVQLKGYVLNIYYFFLRLNLLNHIANPYIYWFYDIKFRNEFRRICCDGVLKRCPFAK
jgi:hypothetical protein